MKNKLLFIRVLAFVVLVGNLLLIPESSVQAEVPNAYDLIAAVNSLRASQGLGELTTDGSLMSAAQSHSEYQAQVGHWTHEGSGGTRPIDRAIAAGYGGGSTVFVSENVAEMASSGSIDFIVYTVWADAVHWNTMTNPSYTHVGAGVAEKDGTYYYTLDVGYIAGSSGTQKTSENTQDASSSRTPSSGIPSGSAITSTVSQKIVSVITSTPNDDGSIVHEVAAGQAAWGIAVAYGVKIVDLAQLNKLNPTNPVIQIGQKLLIRQAFTPSPSPTITETPRPPTRTTRPTLTKAPPTIPPTQAPTHTPTSRPLLPKGFEFTGRSTLGVVILVVCALGLLLVFLSGLSGKSKK